MTDCLLKTSHPKILFAYKEPCFNGYVTSYPFLEQSAEEGVSTSKDATGQPQKRSPDSGIPPSPRNVSVSTAPAASTTPKEITTEITNNTQEITHAQDKGTTDKLESRAHVSDQVANVDGENPKNSQQSISISDETRKESDSTRESGKSRTVWDRPWTDNEAGGSRKEFITQETDQR